MLSWLSAQLFILSLFPVTKDLSLHVVYIKHQNTTAPVPNIYNKHISDRDEKQPKYI